jgi:hypothetical protein
MAVLYTAIHFILSKENSRVKPANDAVRSWDGYRIAKAISASRPVSSLSTIEIGDKTVKWS